MDFNIDWSEIVRNLAYLGIAYVLALPVAFDREQESRSAGIRTFPLVAVSACGYALVGMSVLGSTDAESRVLQGIITGIGFIGGGAILKGSNSVKGTATAASIWNMGLVGIAVAFGRIEIALLLSLINVATLRLIRDLVPEDVDRED